jgi:hypothetical protein
MFRLLLTLGAEMGLDVWVARNDRSRIYNGKALGNLPGMVQELPTQFNDATQRTIELIDVLWLKGNSILSARILKDLPVTDSTDVPFFFKQWGGVRKKRAGRVLEGRTWDQIPGSNVEVDKIIAI